MEKQIALFGGSGKTGKAFLQQALKAGYKVKALLRTPDKLNISNPNLTIIPGDVLTPATVEQTVEDCDIVVSLFGHVKGSPANLQTDGTKHIVEAMNKHEVPKIISLSGGGLPYEKDKPKFADYMIRTIMKIVVPKILNDAKAHAKVLEESDREWMIVRAPRLTEEPYKGNYRVGWVGVNASTKIGREDLAEFILEQIQKDEFKKEMPFVSY